MKPQGSERNAIKRGNDNELDFGILWSLVGCHRKQAQISVFRDLGHANARKGMMLNRPLNSQTLSYYGAPA